MASPATAALLRDALSSSGAVSAPERPNGNAPDLRTHGITKDPTRLTRDEGPWYYEQHELGFNYRITDLQCALGLSQMRKADAVVARRVENQRRYERRFAAAPQFHVPSDPEGETCSISFVALAATPEHRDRVAELLKASNVETRPLGGGSMGRQPFWAERFGQRAFPVADAIHTRSFMLPNNPQISLADVDLIADLVLSVPVTTRSGNWQPGDETRAA